MTHEIKLLKEQMEDMKREMGQKESTISQLRADVRKSSDETAKRRDNFVKFIENKVGEKLDQKQMDAIEAGQEIALVSKAFQKVEKLPTP